MIQLNDTAGKLAKHQVAAFDGLDVYACLYI
jgi:hypothetical protein